MMISAAVESRCATAGALKSVIRTQSAWGTRLHKVFQSFSTPQKAGIVANMTGSTVAQYLAALPGRSPRRPNVKCLDATPFPSPPRFPATPFPRLEDLLHAAFHSRLTNRLLVWGNSFLGNTPFRRDPVSPDFSRAGYLEFKVRDGEGKRRRQVAGRPATPAEIR